MQLEDYFDWQAWSQQQWQAQQLNPTPTMLRLRQLRAERYGKCSRFPGMSRPFGRKGGIQKHTSPLHALEFNSHKA